MIDGTPPKKKGYPVKVAYLFIDFLKIINFQFYFPFIFYAITKVTYQSNALIQI